MNESNKGDIGVAHATADLIKKGFEILLPVSASSPYDMVIHKNNKFYKVQVKYRENNKGYVDIELRRAKSIGKVRHHRSLLSKEVDLYAVYCPDTSKVYYLSAEGFEDKQTIRLRLERPDNFRTTKSTRWAEDCLNLDFLDSD
jgi:hypothetical protein